MAFWNVYIDPQSKTRIAFLIHVMNPTFAQNKIYIMLTVRRRSRGTTLPLTPVGMRRPACLAMGRKTVCLDHPDTLVSS